MTIKYYIVSTRPAKVGQGEMDLTRQEVSRREYEWITESLVYFQGKNVITEEDKDDEKNTMGN